MGDPVDPLFSDREVFSDFFTGYYTRWEPEYSLVAEADGKVVGYLTGSVRYRFHPFAQSAILLTRIAPRVAFRLAFGLYNGASRRFILWALTRSLAETPRRPKRAAHFHINLLPGWRNGTTSRMLIFTFLDMAERAGAKKVFGRIQTYADRRPVRVFERYGFRLFDQRRLSRFAGLVEKTVFVSTFVKDLS